MCKTINLNITNIEPFKTIELYKNIQSVESSHIPCYIFGPIGYLTSKNEIVAIDIIQKSLKIMDNG